MSLADKITFGEIDEGLKDVLQLVKKKFKQVWQYMKGLVVKLGDYFVTPVDTEGRPEPVILPPTMGFAYKAGAINKETTFIHLSGEDAKVCGLRNSLKDALNLSAYSQYKDKMDYIKAFAGNLKESQIDNVIANLKEEEVSDLANLNEVKLEADDPNGLKVADNKTLKMLIKQAWRTRGNAGRLCIWGAPGIGKTAILSTAIKDIDPSARLIVKTLANETGESFSLPDYVIDPETGEKTGARDVLKTWLPMYKVSGDPSVDAERDSKLGTGLLFIDELSRANPQAKNVILPIINEGEWEGYKLGSGWCIIAASNRIEDDPNENFSNGMALMNRFKHVYYQPSVSTWREWAEKQGFMSPLLLQWLSLPESENMSGGKYFYYDPNPDLEKSDKGSVVMCTPRSWTKAMMDLADLALNDLDIDAPLADFKTIFKIPYEYIRMALGGTVTDDACEGFIAFLRVISSVGDFDSVVRSVWEGGGRGLKIDAKKMRTVSLPLAQLIITSHPELPTEKEMVSLGKFLTTVGNDQMTSYIVDIMKHTYFAEVADRKAFIECLFDIKNAIAEAESTPDGKQALKLFSDRVAPILQRYGIASIHEFPDYSEFLSILADKYADVYSKIKFNGKDAMGLMD